MFGPKKPNYIKLRTNLRLCINRLKLLEKKKTELALKARREISEYIKICKDDRARIRVEHIIREDYLVEAMEIVELFCDLLLARFGIIEKMVELDPGLEDAIATIFWATPRMCADVPEMQVVSQNLALKYGKEFMAACQSNANQKVNDKVLIKMAVQSPPRKLIEMYLIEIAKSFDVPFTPDETALMEDELTEAQNLLDLEFEGAPGNIPRGPGGKPGGAPPPGWGGGGGGGGGYIVPPELFPPASAPHQSFPSAHMMHAATGYPESLPPGYAPPGEGPPGYTPPGSAPYPGFIPSNPGFIAQPPPLPSQGPVGASGSMPTAGPGPPKPPRNNGTPINKCDENIYEPYGYDPPPSYPSDAAPIPPPRDESSSTTQRKPVPAPRTSSSGTPGLPDLPSIPTDDDPVYLPVIPSGPPGGNAMPGGQRPDGGMFMNLPSVPTGGSVQNTAADDIDFDDLTKRFEDLKKKK